MVVSESPAVGVGPPAMSGSPSLDRKQGIVLITGRGTEVAFNLDESAPLEELTRELDTQLAGQTSLFSKGGISVNTGNRSLTSAEQEEIRRIFREKSGLKVARFVSGDAAAIVEESPGNAASPPAAPQPAPALPAPSQYPQASPAVPESAKSAPSSQLSSAELARILSGISAQGQRSRDNAMVVRGTVRSGESLQHPGDLVALGDVNPGAEVVADGDIVVLGVLKGLAHAGASGDNKAAIIALEIASPRLRIGAAEAQAALREGSRRGGKGVRSSHPAELKIAYVRQGSIYVSSFAGRFARYTEGVPYEG